MLTNEGKGRKREQDARCKVEDVYAGDDPAGR